MIVALIMTRTIWIAALAQLAHRILGPKGSDVHSQLSSVRKLEVTSDPDRPGNADLPIGPVPAPHTTPLHQTISDSDAPFSINEEQQPYGPSPYTEILGPPPEMDHTPIRPFNHDPNATPEQALREADALWQTLLHALQTHINNNLTTPASPTRKDTDLDKGESLSDSRPAPTPESKIVLLAHSTRHLNTLTLILKRIQNSRIKIHQALEKNTQTAPAYTNAELKLLNQLQKTINQSHAIAQKHISTDPITPSVQTEIKNPKSPITPPAPHSQNAILNTLLDIILNSTYFTPDPNATLTTAIRQCDALWQTIQSGIPPLIINATTARDLNNLTTAQWRITTARQQALNLLPQS